MTLSALALTTIPQIRTALNLTTTQADDPTVEGLIDAVSALMENYTGRVLASRTFTDEPQDGNGRNNLYLRGDSKPAYPVTALTALTLLTLNLQQPYPINVTPSGNQVRVEPATGRLTLYFGAFPILLSGGYDGGLAFPLGRNNILASFTAGFSLTTHPAQRRLLERLAITGVQWLLADVARESGATQVRVGDTSVTYAGGTAAAVLPSVIQTGLQSFICRQLA